MTIIIPVAGAGTRLRPHTLITPKPLLPVAGRPILAWILDPVVQLEPSNVIFVVGVMSEQIIDWVKSTYQFKATFVQQDQLLGLGYALHLAMQQASDDPLLIILGDSIIDCDLRTFVSAGSTALGLCTVPDPQRFGIAEIVDGSIVGLEEKPDRPKSDLAIVGLYYFADPKPVKSALQSHVASGKRTRGEIQFTDALQAMLASGVSFSPFVVHDWFDCGKVETMLQTNRHLLTRRPPPVSEIGSGSVVLQPSLIGPECQIINSEIGPYASIGAGSRITGCKIRDTIIGERTILDSVILEASIIGPDVRIRGQETSGRWNVGAGSTVEID